MDFKIAKAPTNSFLEIAALDRIAWSENANPTYIPDGEHIWRIWVEYALVFNAYHSTELIGSILATPTTDHNLYIVHKVFVAAEYRNKGIGTLLFKQLLTRLDDMNCESMLTVDPQNSNAIKLYEKWGYSDKTYIKGFYRENEDRFILKRSPVKK